jgi:hypothetical protein
MKNTIEIYMNNDAPAFIAGLVREGVTFTARQVEDKLIITMTGGF